MGQNGPQSKAFGRHTHSLRAPDDRLAFLFDFPLVSSLVLGGGEHRRNRQGNTDDVPIRQQAKQVVLPEMHPGDPETIEFFGAIVWSLSLRDPALNPIHAGKLEVRTVDGK